MSVPGGIVWTECQSVAVGAFGSAMGTCCEKTIGTLEAANITDSTDFLSMPECYQRSWVSCTVLFACPKALAKYPKPQAQILSGLLCPINRFAGKVRGGANRQPNRCEDGYPHRNTF